MTRFEAPSLAGRAGEGGGWGHFRARLATRSLVLAVGIAPALAIAAPLGLAPLLLAAALLILVGDGWPRLVLRRLRPIAAILAALVLWGAITPLWSIDPLRSAGMAARLALTFAAGAVLLDKALRLDRGECRRLARAGALGTAIGIALLLIEAATGQALLGVGRALVGAREPLPTMMNRAATFLALIMWPAAYGLHARGRSGLGLALLLAALATLSLLVNTTAVLAAAIATVVGGLALVLPRLTRWAVVSLAAAGILLAPYAVRTLAGMESLHVQIKPSAVHRLMIWRFTADRIAERPLLGWGLETARDLPGGRDEVSFQTSAGVLTREALPLHAHNAALQIRVELGVVGAALFAALIVAIGLALRRTSDRIGHAARLALLASALAIAMASYGVWQFWWLAALALVVALVAGLPDPGEMSTSEENRSPS
jgi:O-antigen ligase